MVLLGMIRNHIRVTITFHQPPSTSDLKSKPAIITNQKTTHEKKRLKTLDIIWPTSYLLWIHVFCQLGWVLLVSCAVAWIRVLNCRHVSLPNMLTSEKCWNQKRLYQKRKHLGLSLVSLYIKYLWILPSHPLLIDMYSCIVVHHSTL